MKSTAPCNTHPSIRRQHCLCVRQRCVHKTAPACILGWCRSFDKPISTCDFNTKCHDGIAACCHKVQKCAPCTQAARCLHGQGSHDSEFKVGTGHVTAGGSICIEALTLSGTAGSWTSQYNVESILNIVMLNMIGEILPASLGFWCGTGPMTTQLLFGYIYIKPSVGQKYETAVPTCVLTERNND